MPIYLGLARYRLTNPWSTGNIKQWVKLLQGVIVTRRNRKKIQSHTCVFHLSISLACNLNEVLHNSCVYSVILFRNGNSTGTQWN